MHDPKTPARPADADHTASSIPESPGVHFDRLVSIVHRLRAPDGCPWDRAQTLESLCRFVLEEAYELVDAIDRNDTGGLRDELGDFVLEAVLLAEIGAEQGRVTIGEALVAVRDKLVRRHPHVFGQREDGAPLASVTSAGDVKALWERIKTQERSASGDAPSVLGGIPKALPALVRAYKIGLRTAMVGFDWSNPQEVLNKVDEELAELREAVRHGRPAGVEEELGDLLFAVANLARQLGLEPESALRRANQKFTRRFEELERRFAATGRALAEVPLAEMEEEWRRVKRGV